METSIFLCGVGGQGILKLNELISWAALLAGNDVKGNEVHGMAQRGGSVVCHLRIGSKVYSPLIPMGEADFILSLEKIEVLRYHHYLKKEGGKVMINDFSIIPTTVATGSATYPENAGSLYGEVFSDYILLPATKMASEAGTPRAANTVLAGCLAPHLNFEDNIWEKAIEKVFPSRLVEINREAFQKGFSYAARLAQKGDGD